MKQIILLVIIILSSCSTSKIMYEQKDSIITKIETEWRDSIVKVDLPEENITINTPLRDTVYLYTSLAQVTIYKTDTLYKVQLRNRSEIPLLVPIEIPIQKVTTTKESIIKQTEIKEIHSLYWWQKTLIWIGIIAIVALIIEIVWKLYSGRIGGILGNIKGITSILK